MILSGLTICSDCITADPFAADPNKFVDLGINASYPGITFDVGTFLSQWQLLTGNVFHRSVWTTEDCSGPVFFEEDTFAEIEIACDGFGVWTVLIYLGDFLFFYGTGSDPSAIVNSLTSGDCNTNVTLFGTLFAIAGYGGSVSISC